MKDLTFVVVNSLISVDTTLAIPCVGISKTGKKLVPQANNSGKRKSTSPTIKSVDAIGGTYWLGLVDANDAG